MEYFHVLRRITQFLGLQLLQSANDTEAGIAWFLLHHQYNHTSLHYKD